MKPYSTIKKLIFFILMFSVDFGFSQNFEKDTLQLPEVRISNATKAKEMKFRFKGLGCVHLCSLSYETEMVTLVNTLPEGYLKSVTMNFNNGTSTVSYTHLTLPTKD